jgi:ATPase subunit of ABC transporter with duplicated ATPase domains
MNDLQAETGLIKWAENASLGYCPQDTSAEFESELNLFDWMSQWSDESHDDQIVRATLGRLLFSSEDFKKSVNVCSGGEKNRLLFGKLIMSLPNVMLLDEPTNHLDMEAIEALNLALEHYEGTLIFVSHDREFVSSLATRIVEIKDQQLNDFHGTYEEYLLKQAQQGRVAG